MRVNDKIMKVQKNNEKYKYLICLTRKKEEFTYILRIRKTQKEGKKGRERKKKKARENIGIFNLRQR